ncbi:MAG: 7-carboxy-7-deazaguanine synthase QueE [Sulfuritalea sp.]|nr:7-carboxy-7-deazaguanine synthase QueE [Sulfuritalea sp.]
MPDAHLRNSLHVTEIFHSIQGESSRVGLPTVFVRLTGCPLRCVWCDTEYAFVTGGEPLAQKNCLPLLLALCDAGHSVSLETSGALDIGDVDPRVARIVDLKAPGSGEAAKNRWENIDLLTPEDELKFVLASREDYDWAVSACHQRRVFERCPVLFSPVQGQLDPAQLAQWILDDRLPVRFQLQLHKVLWDNAKGR